MFQRRWLLAPGARVAVMVAGLVLAVPASLAQPASSALAGRLGDGLITQVEALAAQRPGTGPLSPAWAQQVVAAVLAHPDALGVAAQAAAAQGATREAAAALRPQLSGSGVAGRRETAPDTVLQTPPRSGNELALGLTLRQLVFDFGASTGSVAAAAAREAALGSRLASRRSELALRAVNAWVDLERERQQLRLAQDLAATALGLVDLVRERERIGGGSRADVVRAEARHAEALATIIAARRRVLAAEAAFAEAFGAPAPAATPLPPDADLPPGAARAVAEPGAWAGGMASVAGVEAGVEPALLAALVAGFPGLNEAELVVQAARRDYAVAVARERPSVGLEAAVTRRDLVGPGSPGTDGSVQLVVRHSFYSGGAGVARGQQALARQTQAEEELAALRRRVERAVVQTLAEVAQGDALVEARRTAARAAAASLRTVREQFAFNRGTLLDLLRAQEDVYGAGAGLLEAVSQRANSRWQLLHLSGGLAAAVGLPAGGARSPAP